MNRFINTLGGEIEWILNTNQVSVTLSAARTEKKMHFVSMGLDIRLI